MELQVFKHLQTPEMYLVRGVEEPYVTWDYIRRVWCSGLSSTWGGRGLAGHYAREISWLELLVATGTSKEEAEKIWNGKSTL
jgi:hypothetical protein